MSTQIKPNKIDLIKLYSSGKSMAEIAKRLRCSSHKIAYWMSKYNIIRRSWSEASYVKQNPHGDPFFIVKSLSPKQRTLYGLGIGLFMGEGTKTTPFSVKVANTELYIIKIFVKFLLEICGVKKNKIKYSIVSFKDSDVNKVKTYWSRNLKISPVKFGKIVQIPPQGKGTYKRKSEFGVCTVSVSNVKLKSWIMDEIEKCKQAWVV